MTNTKRDFVGDFLKELKDREDYSYFELLRHLEENLPSLLLSFVDECVGSDDEVINFDTGIRNMLREETRDRARALLGKEKKDASRKCN